MALSTRFRSSTRLGHLAFSTLITRFEVFQKQFFLCYVGFCLLNLWFFGFCFGSLVTVSLFLFFKIAYRTAADKFPGKLSELFLVLSDNAPPQTEVAGGFESHPAGRGQKHRLEDDDRMSVHSSDTKRPDVTTSAEKNQGNKPGKSKNQRPKAQK